MRATRTFHPNRPWQKLARRFEPYRIRRGLDLAGVPLTEQERAAVCLFLGLDGVAPHLVSEVGEALSVSRQRGHRLVLQALAKVERHRYPTRSE